MNVIPVREFVKPFWEFFMHETFAQRLHALRESSNQRLDEFSAILNIGRTTLHRYEKGEREPDAVFLLRLHTVLGVSIDWLLTGQREEGRALTTQEVVLLESFRKMAPDDRMFLLESAARLARIDWAAIAEASKGPNVLKLISDEDWRERGKHGELQVKKTKREAKAKEKSKKAGSA